MKLADYNYKLPAAKIAKHPPKKRGDARLLVLERKSGELADQKYSDILEYLNVGDVLVLNNTKVIKARLLTTGSDGKQHEILLTEKHGHQDERFHHKVIYRGNLIEGMDLRIGEVNLRVVGVYGDGTALLESPVDFMELAEKYGHVPLPPYMKRQDTIEDSKRYQTEFALNSGSVAAPTASLNMTEQLIRKIKAKGVKVCYLTLHVGLGTFLPIRTDDIKDHTMHSEWFSVPAATLQAIRNAKENEHKVVAVGTTVARTLEYCADVISSYVEKSQGSLRKGRDDNFKELSGEADIFIYPGYEFKVVDALLTNFHAPKSTVLMLAAAFAHSTGSAHPPQVGWKNLHNAYLYALKNDYCFLSYGDSMLIVD